MSESGTFRTYSHVRVESEKRRITDSRAGRNEPIRASMGDGVICPTGFRRRGLSSLSCKNILLFRIPKSVIHFRRLVPLEGRFAIVTSAGRDAVDADGASDEGADCERRSRVVLTPQWLASSRRRQLRR